MAGRLASRTVVAPIRSGVVGRSRARAARRLAAGAVPEGLGARAGRERLRAAVWVRAGAAFGTSLRSRVPPRAGSGIGPRISPRVAPRLAPRITSRVAPSVAPRIASKVAPRFASRVATGRWGPLTRLFGRWRDRHPSRGGGASNRGTPRVAGLCTGTQGRPVGGPLRRTGRRRGVTGRFVLRVGCGGISGVGGSHLGIGSRSAGRAGAMCGAVAAAVRPFLSESGVTLRGSPPVGTPLAPFRRTLPT